MGAHPLGLGCEARTSRRHRMQGSNVNTPITDHVSRIFVAIELSQKSWLVALHSPDKDKIAHHRVAGGDHAGLLALIGRVRDRAIRALGAVPAVVSCYEAGYDGFWLHRLFTAAGNTHPLVDPFHHPGGQGGPTLKNHRENGQPA